MRRRTLLPGLAVAAACAAAVSGIASGAAAPAGSASNPIVVRKSHTQGFSPAVATVSPRALVHFRNLDGARHNVVQKTSGTPLFISGPPTRHDFTVRAPARPGRYAYTCSVHGFMHGTLVVRR